MRLRLSDFNDLGFLIAHPLCYLATPYSKYAEGIDAASEIACKIAGKLITEGVSVFSPIAHSHGIAKAAGINPLDHDVWLDADRPMMDAATALIVAKIPGWRDSKGVSYEIVEFCRASKPVFFLEVIEP